MYLQLFFRGGTGPWYLPVLTGLQNYPKECLALRTKLTIRVVNLKVVKLSQICLVVCLLRSRCAVCIEQLYFRLLIWTTLSRLLLSFLSQRNDTITGKPYNYGSEILVR